MNNLKGIFPALLTPFDRQDKINEPVLRQIVKLGITQKADGFYVGGSTAETFLLTIDERKLILEIVIDELHGKLPVIAHIGCISTSQAIDLAKHAQSCGVDAISSVAPFYYQFSFDEIKNYYLDIMDSCSLPMIIYYIPGFSGINLNSEQIGELISDKRVAGFKFTSSDYYTMERIKNLRSDLIIYNGFDEMFLAGLCMGADGGIGSTYNFMADRFVRILELYKKGDMSAALDEQKKANNIIQALIKVGVIPGEKALLELMGIPAGVCRKPFKQISPEEREYLFKIWNENNN